MGKVSGSDERRWQRGLPVTAAHWYRVSQRTREPGLTHLAFDRPMASAARGVLCIETKAGTQP